MKPDNQLFNGYDTGSDFWLDTIMSHGIDEAITICGNYLDLNMKREHSDDEKNFSREVFVAMYQATVNKVDPRKIMYPYPFEEAVNLLETSYYTMSQNINRECSRAITKAINDSCYNRNYYNIENAAWKVLLKYGFNRVNAILAHQIQEHEHDGRYSQANKKWAKEVILPAKVFNGTFMDAHATLIESFAGYVRKLCADMDAGRYALPGDEEQGEFIHGYEIKRAIMVSSQQGYAIAYNPDAVDPYVCWQFKLRDGERHYNWGAHGSEQDAVDSLNARLFIYYADTITD